MLTDSDLRTLVAFSSPSLVLSVYLNTEPSEGNAEAYKLRLRTMLKPIYLPEDTEAVIRYVEHEYGGQGRGVAVFSCAAQKFFNAFPLAVPVPDLVHVSDRASVKPWQTCLTITAGMAWCWWISKVPVCFPSIWENCANRKEPLEKQSSIPNGAEHLQCRAGGAELQVRPNTWMKSLKGI